MKKLIEYLDYTIAYFRDGVNPFQRGRMYEAEQVKKKIQELDLQPVMGELTCDNCGCHPNVIYTTSKGRFCESCKPAS
jgi:hypothetical protein